MPQIAAAIAGVIGAFQATAVGTFLTTTFTGRLLASVALSALQAALVPKPKAPGITTEFTANGGTNPCGFILGKYATAGDAVCPPMTHGVVGKTPNAYLTYVVALGDVAGQTLERVMIDGAYVDLGATPHADYGLPVTGRYDGFAWVKYYDGSQTVADPMLLAKYGTDPERPWLSDMVGTGICYAICTFRFSRKRFQALPNVLFQCGGIKVYDPRKDTTVGGSGAHRWGTPSTYELSRNNAVLAYNVARGITLASLGVWGGSIAAEDLPLSNWFTAMNECDTTIGTPAVAQYQAGYEVRVDAEPAAVLEELMKGCTGQLAEVGGEFKIRVGGPGLPVLFLTDDDLIVTAPQDYQPFVQADQRFNGIDAKYPDPGAVWQAKAAPSRYNTTWEAEDGARRVTTLDLPACPFPDQVQRVMNSYITDERRYRRHGLTLPPDAAVLEPLDTVSWTSTRNGYASKLFEVAEITDNVGTILQRVSIRECDPTDYSWSTGSLVAVTLPSAEPVVPASQTLSAWTVTPVSIADAAGTARRAAIKMTWSTSDMDGVDSIQYQVRVAATGVVIKIGTTTDVGGGVVILAEGILPSVLYQAQGLPIARSRDTSWTAWTDCTAPSTGFTNADFVGGAYSTLFTSQGLYAIRDVTSLPGSGSFVGEKIFNRTDGKLYQWTGAAWQLTVSDVAAGAVTATSFASGIRPIEIVSALPTTGNFQGRTVMLTTDNKIYRHTGSPTGSAGFTSVVPAVDLTGQVAGTQIADAAISIAKFASGITPIEVVATLPTVGNFTGRTVFLTSDGKLYRYASGAFNRAVDGADITANSIVAGKIAAGAIGADEIAAGAITAQHMLLQPGNMVANSKFSSADLAGWRPWSAPAQQSVVPRATAGVPTGAPTLNVAKFTATAAAQVISTFSGAKAYTDAGSDLAAMPMLPGRKYRVTIQAAEDATYAASVFQVIIYYRKTDGTLVYAGAPISAAASLNSVWQEFTGIFTAPADIVGAWAYVYSSSGAAGSVYWTNLSIREMAAAELIVDGTITATQIAANTITAAKIAAGTITATEIAANTITAGQIAAAAISASELAAGAVTTAKLAAGAVTATEIAAGTITGAKIAANTITAGLLATSGLITNSAQINNGLITNAHIAGAIQSTNFVTGVSGWKIDKTGAAEFNSLIVRTSIVDGAVSDKIYASYAGPYNGVLAAGASATVLTLSIGQTLPNEIRKYGFAYEWLTNNGAVYEVHCDIRFKYAGVWGTWITKLNDTGPTAAWQANGYSATLAGVYDDAEIRLVVYRPGATGSTPTNYIKNVYMTCVNLVK